MTHQQPDNQVTALAFLTPAEHGHHYQPFCHAVGIEPIPDGWGLALVTAPTGERVTLFTQDINYLHLVHAGVTAGFITDDEPEPLRLDKFTHRRDGWPNEWNLGGAR